MKPSLRIMSIATILILWVSTANAALLSLDVWETKVLPSHDVGSWVHDEIDYSYAVDTWTDFVGGPRYKIHGMDLQLRKDFFEFQFVTNFEGYKKYTGTAAPGKVFLGDLFFSTKMNETYDAAFSFAEIDFNTFLDPDKSVSFSDQKLYSVKSWTTSTEFYGTSLGGTLSGSYFTHGVAYGAFDQDGNLVKKVNPAIVEVGSGTRIEDYFATLSRSAIQNGMYTYTVTGYFDLVRALGMNWGDSFDVLWTQTCGNAAIMATVNTVPEPGTLLLLFMGLGGLVLVRMRFRSRNSG
ncbi:MAG: PEP-CTERM sorting domain-containing protein [Desulfovibrionales bacterium]|nr:MAG: PEP-CTERM sorting domain-containing protein [Desulfovibrionales bacterium]